MGENELRCTWDHALIAQIPALPPGLIDVIRSGSSQQYLEALTKAALQPSLWRTVFAHCGSLLGHISASVCEHESLAQALAFLGRTVPYAPYLSVFATNLLEHGNLHDSLLSDPDNTLPFLLGLYRLLKYDPRTFTARIATADVYPLLQHPSMPVRYIAICILRVSLQGADAWFESMILTHIGPDRHDGSIQGIWEDKMIDYRFFDLWEHQRDRELLHFLSTVTQRSSISAQPDTTYRLIPTNVLHPSTCLLGGIVFPRLQPIDSSPKRHRARFVNLPSTIQNLGSIARALQTSKPILLTGLAGSGKTLLVDHVASELHGCNKMLTLHLNEQSDIKLLIGIYTTGSQPGSFVWTPGILTTAVTEGRWLFIEDLDRAPNEILSTLLPLIERRQLPIPSRKRTISAHPDFRIIATVRSDINHRGNETQPAAGMIGLRHWQSVKISAPKADEQQYLVQELFPSLAPLLPQIMAVYDRASDRILAKRDMSRNMGVLRPISLRDLLKWCKRISSLVDTHIQFTSKSLDEIFLEAVDCFAGDLPASFSGAQHSSYHQLTKIISEVLQIDPQRRDFLLRDREPQYEITNAQIRIGRCSLARHSSKMSIEKAVIRKQSFFSTDPHTCRVLERVATAVKSQEHLLLVGETGVGKTTVVQQLATQVGKRLIAFNLSQQSEAGDMLGGFKPVTIRSQIMPLNDEFIDLFGQSFSQHKNARFLDLLGVQLKKGNWKAVTKMWRQSLQMVDAERQKRRSHSTTPTAAGVQPSKKRRVESIDYAQWDAFSAKISGLHQRLEKESGSFAFSFVEGRIVEAVRNGDWVLLDEINLASPDTLESLLDLLSDSPSLLLTEAGHTERVEAAPGFRIFAAMNPATDIGKKDLPPSIRSRFTELYVESPDRDTKSLQSIIRGYLREHANSDRGIVPDVAALYQSISVLVEENQLVDGGGTQPHFSLRTLTRSLQFALHAVEIGSASLRRAMYEGFLMGFTTFLDSESEKLVLPVLKQTLFARLKRSATIESELHKPLRQPMASYGSTLQPYPGSKHWLKIGPHQQQSQDHYIITPFIQRNLENLVRATCTERFPVLIQGPTSSGKTSMIEYLAKRTGHKYVRINNHEFTDLQEYLGTYVSDSAGKLSFREGILVRALRDGSWVVLDELNLAPTDVLEALNRLLDDNRELFVPELQETVRPAAGFQIFATQNPAGLYGGRKALSRAFRNRFLELHFDDIPVEELQTILHQRSLLPESRCKRIVQVYRELSILRQENRVFEQKNSFATLRDLFRWASRGNDTIEDLAVNGFMLLAERVRSTGERLQLKQIIERVMSANGPAVRIEESELYGDRNQDLLAYRRGVDFSNDVVWTKAMRRLYVLVSRAIANDEPVLLVGETGCGKTTVVQMLSDALGRRLNTLNAHANTESGDLIGSQRPVRNRASVETELRELLFSTTGSDNSESHSISTDVLLASYDKNLSATKTVSGSRTQLSSTQENIHRLRVKWRSLFEWTDGSLVSALKNGEIFLLDEINLADDSVLERINSVLEPSRTILLAEKGMGSENDAADSPEIVAKPGFQFLATMNPGGDYGKRELSPALRNRFTEIWVPPLQDTEDIVTIVSAKLPPAFLWATEKMVAFAAWFKARYNTSAASTISIRDALAWIDFIQSMLHRLDPVQNLTHGASMVFVDTLGSNPAGLTSLPNSSVEKERETCMRELARLLGIGRLAPAYVSNLEVVANRVKIGPFTLARSRATLESNSTFSFQAPTTRVNAMRVARAMQLLKPILLEGSPGVGKTALVTAIANACNAPLIRVNLSEQTDLMDLFGSDVPISDAESHPSGVGEFAWKDAPLLTAMKTGQWFLLDEMNLASQSVLEGLNSVIDHRGEVYIPEIGLKIQRHPDFRLFATQNPHHQGGGRKGLPASFVNRFTVVYADAFHKEDMMVIAQSEFPNVNTKQIEQVVDFVTRLDVEVGQRKRFGLAGGPWEFNLRDVFRWLRLCSSQAGLLRSGGARDFVSLLFSQRFRTEADRALLEHLLTEVIPDAPPRSDIFVANQPLHLQVGLGLISRHPLNSFNVVGPSLEIWPDSLLTLQSLIISVEQSWPITLIGPNGCGKSMLIEHLASLVGADLTTLSVNADTDAMDLVGGYEQVDPAFENWRARDRLIEEVRVLTKKDLTTNDSARVLAETLDMLTVIETPNLLPALARVQAYVPEAYAIEFQALMKQCLEHHEQAEMPTFRWVDGILVDALVTGKWLVLDNANLCPSSALDRLNGLLEPNGSLILNENTDAISGEARVIKPHRNFRIFLTLDPKQGELSRAMRNRTVELHLGKPKEEIVLLDPGQLINHSSLSRLSCASALSSFCEPRNRPQEVDRVFFDQLSPRDELLLGRLQGQLNLGLYQNLESSEKLFLLAQDLGLVGCDDIRVSHQQLQKQLSASTDHAFIQIFYPLTNQPLVQQTAEVFSHVLRHAVSYDTALLMTQMQKMLSETKSNSAFMKTLVKAEKSMPLKRHTNKSVIVSVLENLPIIMSRWAQNLPCMDTERFLESKSVINMVCSLWWLILDVIKCDPTDYTQLHAILVAVAGKKSSSKANGILQKMRLATEDAMKTLGRSSSTNFGHPCLLLWRSLRPLSPQSLEALRSLLDLEVLAARFDGVARQFQHPLNELVTLRRSLARALEAGNSGMEGFPEVLSRVAEVLPNLEINTAKVEPHFKDSFACIHQQLSLLHISGYTHMDNTTSSELGLLALLPTYADFSFARGNVGNKKGSSKFRHLKLALPQSVSKYSSTFPKSLLKGLRTMSEVHLGDSPLLKSEIGVLGFNFASKADILTYDTFTAFNTYLEQVTGEVIKSLAQNGACDDPQGPDEKSFEGIIESLAEQNDTADPSERVRISAALGQLHDVCRHFQGYSMTNSQATKVERLATSWLKLGLAGINLYLTDDPFDPALVPRMEMALYQKTHRRLDATRSGSVAFSQSTNGQAITLRSRLLSLEIDLLGESPTVDQIYRPLVGDMHLLHNDLRDLRRSLEHYQKATSSELKGNSTFWSNLDLVRKRLDEHYSGYRDFTGPIVGFIDCISISRLIITQNELECENGERWNLLSAITPLHGATFETYMSDGGFARAMHRAQGPKWRIHVLTSLATRTPLRQLSESSSEFIDSVQKQFLVFYELWRQQLNQGQKEMAAKSSLYRYRGDAELQEQDNDEEVERLFPTFNEGVNIEEVEVKQMVQRAQDLAPQLADLHRRIFSSDQGTETDFLEPLGTLTDLAIVHATSHLSPDEVPMILNDVSNEREGTIQITGEKFDIYRHGHRLETERLLTVVRQAQARFQALHHAWPEHTTPVDALRVCEQLLSCSHTQPLMMYLQIVEKLHALVTEWEKVASRQYNATEVLEDVTSIIVDWRRLELSTWAGLFDQEILQCQKDALSWWYVAYENIIVASHDVGHSEFAVRSHTESLLQTLSVFFENSGLGEYRPRLQLLGGFKSQLDVSCRDDCRLELVRNGLTNFINYYSRFDATVTETLSKGRSDLEKKVNDVIQLASWKDRNIHSLRQSAKSSHKKLFRLIKNYRGLLAQPLTGIIRAEMPLSSAQTEEYYPTPMSTPKPLKSGSNHNYPNRLDLSVLADWSAPFRNVQTTVHRMEHIFAAHGIESTGASGIRSFMSQLEEDSKELRKSTPSRLTDDNKSLVAQLKNRKRLVLSDALKRIRKMGFKSNMSSEAIAKQASLFVVLTDIPIPPGDTAGPWQKDISGSALDGLLHTMTDVRLIARDHSDDLTDAEVARCSAHLESMLERCVIQRKRLFRHITQVGRLRSVFEKFEAFSAQTNEMCPSQEISQYERLYVLPPLLESLLYLVNRQCELSRCDRAPVINGLKQLAKDARAVCLRYSSISWVPDGTTSQETRVLNEQGSKLLSRLTESIREWTLSYSELGPILAQGLKWTSESKQQPQLDSRQPRYSSHRLTEMLLNCGSQILNVVQNLENTQRNPKHLNAGTWLVNEELDIHHRLENSKIESVTTGIQSLLTCISDLDPLSSEQLKLFSEACAQILPILHSFVTSVEALIGRFSTLHCETAWMGYKLAKMFLQLGRQGFCGPSEKTSDSSQQEGDVETGTGLGDGEGAEDVSKDIGADEDLSEIAQEYPKGENNDEIEAEKDAVDMADEDFEGNFDDEVEQDDNGHETADDAGENEVESEVGEETGEVDNLGPGSVDERFWDGEENEEQRSKTAEDGKGLTEQNELAAANKDDSPKQEGEQSPPDSHVEESGGDEKDEVGQAENEQIEDFAKEQQNLDLPEDMEIDGRQTAESDSEVGSVSGEEVNVDGQEIQEKQDHDGDAYEDEENSGSKSEPEGLELEDSISEARSRADEEPVSNEDEMLQEATSNNATNHVDLDPAPENERGPDQGRNDNHLELSAATVENDAPHESSEETQATATGGAGQGQDERQLDAGQSENEPRSQRDESLRQLGDALEEWYRRHGKIDDAEQSAEGDSDAKTRDQDIAEADFQHIGADAPADAQALGAAAPDQSMHLDEEMAIDVNESQAEDPAVVEKDTGKDDAGEDTGAPESMQLDPIEDKLQHTRPQAFIGEPSLLELDTEMQDSMAERHYEVEDVDKKLNDAHIYQDHFEDLTIEEARQLWTRHESNTRNLAVTLTEHLRLILHPTQATKMRGDFRTGKRLNIKRIIPYIASSFKRDKIWMRRTIPSKRSYQIMLAIDDSKSMVESESRNTAFDTLALVARSLSMLEVGELCVVGFGENVTIAQDFSTTFSNESGADVFRHFTFNQSTTNVEKLLVESIELFKNARLRSSGAASELWQLQIIISDGVCEDHLSIRKLVRQANEERIMIVFVVVDAATQAQTDVSGSGSKSKQSIVDLQTAEFSKDSSGEMQLKMTKYLDTFPFNYYLIVKDVQELPGVLASALKQWFAEVIDTGY